MGSNILPDSRARRPVGVVRGPLGNLVPVYCANCGEPQGLVAEQQCTFAFFLCQRCADTLGPIAHTYSEPDSVFWERIKNEQESARIAAMSPAELLAEIENPNSPLAKIAREWQAQAHTVKKGT